FGAWSAARTFSRLFATTPSLITPADMTSTLDPAHTFTWDGVQDAPIYQIQISTDSAFSVSTIELNTVSNSYDYIFDAGGTYYWRVRAKNGAYVGDWSSVYSLTIQSLPAATLIAPVNWFTTTETSVELSWDAVPNATRYELIIARDGFLSQFPIINDMGSATSYTFTTTWGGIYYWTVTPYFDTLAGETATAHQFTLDLLPTPTSPLPANNTTVYSKQVTFTWDAVAGATGYYVLINPYEPITTSSPIYFANTNSYTHTFTFTGNFFWHVYALDGNVTSGMTPMHWLIIKKFDTPNLVAPTDMTTITTSDMTFSWDAVSGGNNYQIQISTSSTFHSSDLLVNQTISATSYAHSFTEGGTYYWRVRAGGANDFESNWSPSRQVMVDTSAIPTVTLLAPAQGSVTTNRTIDFAWTPAAGATAYEFHLTTSSGYHGSLLRQTLTDTTISTSVIQNLNYYWRVRVIYGTLAGAWTTGSFSYDLLPAPTNLLPAPNSIFMTASTSIGNTDVTFSWDAVDYAVSYQIQIATSSNFNIPLEAVITSPTSTHNLASTTYYWRVRAKNDLHFGYWSPAQKVSIGVIPAPTLVSPADGFATTNRTQTYSWTAVPEATSYTFQFSSYPDFDFVAHTYNTPTTNTSYTYTHPYGGLWYWRVRANKSGVGGSVWSQRAITFTQVDAPVPIAPN
ncbi:MAG: hypothetical protein KJ043_10060, partial [Anaerolineae bacterium]|nr:hypothetical protein [Anaerolineae bacterium]